MKRILVVSISVLTIALSAAALAASSAHADDQSTGQVPTQDMLGAFIGMGTVAYTYHRENQLWNKAFPKFASKIAKAQKVLDDAKKADAEAHSQYLKSIKSSGPHEESAALHDEMINAHKIKTKAELDLKNKTEEFAEFKDDAVRTGGFVPTDGGHSYTVVPNIEEVNAIGDISVKLRYLGALATVASLGAGVYDAYTVISHKGQGDAPVQALPVAGQSGSDSQQGAEK